MDVYLAPASIENLNKSVISFVNREILEKCLTEIEMKNIEDIYKGRKVKCWGMNCGSGKYKTYFKNFTCNDYIVFTPRNSGKFKYIGKIVYKMFNEELGQLLWSFKSNKKNEAWKYILFIDDVKEINIDKNEILTLLGYKHNYPVYGLTKLNEDKKYIFLKYIDEIDENTEGFTKNKKSNINDKDIDKLLDKYKNNLIIGEIKKSVHACNKGSIGENYKSKSINNTIKPIKTISPRNAKIIGLLGEKVIYETLLSEGNDILKILNINQHHIIGIEWYNCVIDLYDQSSYMKKDYSMGKGHDIKIITINKEFLIEVKSSYGDSYQISPTSNEMKVMKQNKDYYFFIVENLKNIFIEKAPSIKIVEGFSYNLPEEILESISSINIYTNSDLIRYHTLF
ncbi:DUF3883 domain-containing protein [Paraclostridium bifermentans]|uniref:protein NO VEIN domain-containing protein n=1 Tax=Paraclostridium bifermentans TaxID=1490 RepID=UPI001F2FD45C|nr:DUF3883 domain-containing protein [Paraclostridium bifermentans]MCE9674430.1 DUF3883 domain-containing protein [Paraclostridium bifermentans]